LNEFTRNAKHGLNSWKWPNLAWNSSSSLKIYFSIRPLCGLQLPLRENHSFSFWHSIWTSADDAYIVEQWYPKYGSRPKEGSRSVKKWVAPRWGDPKQNCVFSTSPDRLCHSVIYWYLRKE